MTTIAKISFATWEMKRASIIFLILLFCIYPFVDTLSKTPNDDAGISLRKAVINIANALKEYASTYHKNPQRLEDLVPEYLDELDLPIYFHINLLDADSNQDQIKYDVPVSIIYLGDRPIYIKILRSSIIAFISRETHTGDRYLITSDYKVVSMFELTFQENLLGISKDSENVTVDIK